MLKKQFTIEVSQEARQFVSKVTKLIHSYNITWTTSLNSILRVYYGKFKTKYWTIISNFATLHFHEAHLSQFKKISIIMKYFSLTTFYFTLRKIKSAGIIFSSHLLNNISYVFINFFQVVSHNMEIQFKIFLHRFHRNKINKRTLLYNTVPTANYYYYYYSDCIRLRRHASKSFGIVYGLKTENKRRANLIIWEC